MNSSTFYTKVLPKVYSFGAAVVIIGAMFKLMNWEGGGLMLCSGLLVEASIFLISMFEPPAKDYAWENVFPVLLQNDNVHAAGAEFSGFTDNQQSVSSVPNFSNISYPSLNEDVERVQSGVKDILENMAVVSSTISSVGSMGHNLSAINSNIEHMNITVQRIEAIGKELEGFENMAERTRVLCTNLDELCKNIERMNTVYAEMLIALKK